MRTGSYTGKKMGAMKAFEGALDQIAERSGNNPLQVFVDAICSAAPMEEITRIKFGAVSQPKAVDSSPSRRLDVALANLAKGAQQGTHKSKRTLQNCIINELTKASEGDVTSYALARRKNWSALLLRPVEPEDWLARLSGQCSCFACFNA